MLAHPTRTARLQNQFKSKIKDNDKHSVETVKPTNILLAVKKKVDREIANKVISTDQDATQIQLLKEAENEINLGYLDMVTWGRAIIANPNFVKLVKEGLPLKEFTNSMRESLI